MSAHGRLVVAVDVDKRKAILMTWSLGGIARSIMPNETYLTLLELTLCYSLASTQVPQVSQGWRRYASLCLHYRNRSLGIRTYQPPRY
jgi:hypothetical protein